MTNLLEKHKETEIKNQCWLHNYISKILTENYIFFTKLTQYKTHKWINTVIRIENKDDFINFTKKIKDKIQISAINLDKISHTNHEINFSNWEKMSIDLSNNDEEVEVIYKWWLSLSYIIYEWSKQLIDLFKKIK